MSDLLFYRGHQYRPEHLPKGADPDEVLPLDEYFAQARSGDVAGISPPAPTDDESEPDVEVEPEPDDDDGEPDTAGIEDGPEPEVEPEPDGEPAGPSAPRGRRRK